MASRHDVFFCLTPHARPENTRKVFELPHNACWLQTSTTDIAIKPTISSRESTPAVVPESEFDPHSHSDRLALTFSGLLALVKSGKLPSLEAGIRFGTDPNHCHVLLGHRGTQGVSGQQYTISVNQELSVWLCDHGSKHGTAVMCNKQNGGQIRRNEKWILSNPTGNPGPYSQIVIQAGRVSLDVELPNHTRSSLLYRESLKRLYAECQEAAHYRDDSASTYMGLGLNSCLSTAAASGAMTPDTRPLYYSTAVLGKGIFGEVSLAIQARTGRYFAAKTFADQNKKRRAEEKDEAWRVKVRREFDIAAENLHDNIVRAFELQEEPMAIIMEYYPDGNIEDMRQNMNETAYVSAFGQILCALEHLHARGTVHRDLKPQNVLVQMGPCFKVALTDFGLSNVIQGGTLLSTFCGTLPFTAPEVYPGPGAGYGTSADIWSLGAIMPGWMYDLPEMPSEFDKERPAVWASRWHFFLIRRLRDQGDCAMTALISSMMKPISHHRWDAKQCLRHGFEHQLFRWRKGDGLVVCIDDLVDCEVEPDANDQAGTSMHSTDRTQGAHHYQCD